MKCFTGVTTKLFAYLLLDSVTVKVERGFRFLLIYAITLGFSEVRECDLLLFCLINFVGMNEI